MVLELVIPYAKVCGKKFHVNVHSQNSSHCLTMDPDYFLHLRGLPLPVSLNFLIELFNLIS